MDITSSTTFVFNPKAINDVKFSSGTTERVSRLEDAIGSATDDAGNDLEVNTLFGLTKYLIAELSTNTTVDTRIDQLAVLHTSIDTRVDELEALLGTLQWKLIQWLLEPHSTVI